MREKLHSFTVSTVNMKGSPILWWAGGALLRVECLKRTPVGISEGAEAFTNSLEITAY